MVAGAGCSVITRVIERRLVLLARNSESHPPARRLPSGRSVATLIAAFVVQPVGAIASHIQLRSNLNDATQTVLRISLFVAYSLVVLLGAAIGVALLR